MTSTASLALLALLLLLGCSGEQHAETPIDTAATSAGDTAVTATPPSTAAEDSATGEGGQPLVMTDTVRLEGSEYVTTVSLFDGSAFTTYYSKDEMIADEMSSGEGTGVRFTANFGGTRNDSAFLHIFIPADTTAGPDAARDILLEANGIVRSQGWKATKASDNRCPWAVESYRITGPGGTQAIGFACVGEHAGRGFVVVAAYPGEYGDGMGPRVARILHHMRWKDTGTYLRDEKPSRR